MTDAGKVHPSSLRTQWWLIEQECTSHHTAHSDDWCSNSAPVITPHTLMTDAGIVHQESLSTQWWHTVIVRQSSLRIQWWLMKDDCNSHNFTHSDGCCSNSAPVVTPHSVVWCRNSASTNPPHRLMTYRDIVNQLSLRAQWWMMQ